MSDPRQYGELSLKWDTLLAPINWQVMAVLTLARYRPQVTAADELERQQSPVQRRRVRGLTPRKARASGYWPATPERARTAWRVLVDRLARSRKLRGSHRDAREGSTGELLLWASALEQHKDGQWHINGLISAPPGFAPVTLDEVEKLWAEPSPHRQKFGNVKTLVFDSPNSRGRRYAVKDADLSAEVLVSRAVSKIVI
tara:strand:- start:1266 stop:1862 length:597 start_codon:yes stop_codon:yes gene_type:complete